MGLMDWIKRSFGRPTPPAAAPGLYAKPKVPLPPATPEDWQALTDAVGQALVPNDADALGAEVRLALLQPDAYLAQFGDALMQRGIESPQDVTPWLALVDGLDSREQCAEMDWKLDMDELIASLHGLRGAKERSIVLDALASSENFGADALVEAAALLRPHGVALVSFDIESDCYPLVLLPSAQVAPIQALAQKVGHTIIPL